MRHWVFIGVFVITISLPLMQSILGVVPSSVLSENRNLAPPPNLDTRIRLKQLRKEFDAYYADNFGFRPHLIRIYDKINIEVFKQSNRVLFGKNDWLFLKRKHNKNDAASNSIVDDLCVRSLITGEELNQWVNALVTNWAELQSRGIDYYFVMVPNKHTIHREFLPDRLECINPKTSLDKLVDTVNMQYPSIPFIDLRAGMRQEVNTGKILYFRTDTHWNVIGMLNGYNQIYKVISERNFIRYAAGKDSVKLPEMVVRGGDLARMIGRADSERENVVGIKLRDDSAKLKARPFPLFTRNPRRQPETWSMPERDATTAMFFHDSFFGAEIRKLFVNTFSETTFIWKVYQKIDLSLVDKIKPKIVIHELVERNLWGIDYL